MLTHWRVVIATVALAGLVILSGMLGYATLPWFLWHLLPSAPQRGVLVMPHLTDAPLAAMAAAVVPPAVREHIPAALYLGWAQDGQNLQLVTVPRPQAYQSLPRTLTAAGWQVRRIGPLLLATQGEARWRPLSLVATDYIRSLTISSWPVFPAAIIHTQDSFHGMTSPLAVVMTRRGTKVRIIAAADLSEGSRREVVPVAVPPDHVVITVPGELLAALPTEVHEDLNRQLRLALGFTLTRPDILAHLATYDAASLALRPSGEALATLGVRGDADTFTDTVTSWIQEEERRTRLTTRAFRLPDGTLGYEKIPGEVLPVVTYAPSDQCWHPVEGRSTLWLCAQDGSVGVGMSQALAREGAAAATVPTTSITLGERALAHLQERLSCEDQSADIQTHIFCSLASLRLHGVPERVQLEFVVK